MAIQDLDQPGIVVMERAEHGAALQVAELGPFLIGAGRAAAVDHVQARQRADAVHALRIARGL